MNSGGTSERVYDALKRRILAGTIPPGERLEPAPFAEELGSSITPVREALSRLTGERLVETRLSEGFHMPLWSEPLLRDLYAWNGQLTRLVINAWPRGPTRHHANGLSADLGQATRSLFDLIAARSDNRAHGEQIDMINDRLAAPRVVESSVLPDLGAELRAMAMSFDHDEPGSLLKLLAAYHRRRIQATAGIVRALYQP